MSGKRRGVGASLLRAGLSAAALPYSAAVRLRRWAYGSGFFKSHSADVPVICVGNITTGGVGKTPMVGWVVQQLKQAGKKPVVLSRGYKSVNGVSDEVELLKHSCGVDVVMNPDRLAGAKQAIDLGADILVMDDGFQHLRLKRDLDIVLIDATNPFGFGYPLPRGMLREPVSMLEKAAAIVITRSDMVSADKLAKLKNKLTDLAPEVSIHTAIHRPVCLIDNDGNSQSLEAIAGRKLCSFCGIGNPGSFFSSLEKCGGLLASRITLDDHFKYSADSVRSMVENNQGCDCELWITTQKDYVKLDESLIRQFGRNVWQLVIAMEILDGEDELKDKISNVIALSTPGN